MDKFWTANVTMLVRAVAGMMAPTYCDRRVALECAKMASVVASVAQVDTPTVGMLTIAVVAGTSQTTIPENEYLAFTIAKSNGKGGFKAT